MEIMEGIGKNVRFDKKRYAISYSIFKECKVKLHLGGVVMDRLKILIDTDLGSDCDDAGALAILHRFADAGKIDILGMTHCISEISGAVTIQSINEWYHRAEIPVGRYNRKPFLEGGIFQRHTSATMHDYLKTHEMPQFEDSVRLMRKILSKNDEITLITIGHFNNLAELMQSEPDDISPLSGRELVAGSVKVVYAMAGNFEDLDTVEYNVEMDKESASYVSRNLPCPVVYCGFELGNEIKTGEKLLEQPNENPVKRNYQLHPCKGIRESWDPITIYCAIEKDNDFFEKSEPKRITFRSDGTVQCEDGGKDCWLVKKASNDEIKNEINQWLY